MPKSIVQPMTKSLNTVKTKRGHQDKASVKQTREVLNTQIARITLMLDNKLNVV